ncbi:MAG TPA: winged helix-turn-helix domain-containing protein [Solirubrobacterales bacterium]|nr:winged helix-turn-helix domain-containing protein [Solirubrobacterales bacterium]
MSPSRFAEEAGGELTHIARCFRQLADWGYIEVVEKRPGRRQGAAIEHVYRGIQRAHFDTASWNAVPHQGRNAVSYAAVSSYFARVSEAVDAGTFDAEVDRHLSWDSLALDKEAWGRLGRRLDDVLEWLPELAVEASRRLDASGEEPIPTVVGLSAFRSPQSPVTMLQVTRFHDQAPAPSDEEFVFAFGPAMAKALSNNWRCRILLELTHRPLSPSQFVEEIGGSMTHIARCFRELAELGLVEVFEERPGGRHGGGVERIYRCLRRPYFDATTWETLPRLVREEMSQSFLGSYLDRVAEAMSNDTFDAEEDRHFSWKPVLLDRAAWREVSGRLDEILTGLPDLEQESVARTPELDSLIPTIVGLASFRSPAG